MNISVWKVFYEYEIYNNSNTDRIDTIQKNLIVVGYSHQEIENEMKRKLPGVKIKHIKRLHSVNHISKHVCDFISLQWNPDYRKQKAEERNKQAEEEIKRNQGDVRMRNMSELKPEKQDIWGIL